MKLIRKPPEWWAKQPRCPHVFSRSIKCPGRIVKYKNKFTEQTFYACEEELIFFVGTSFPTEDTPCFPIRCYSSMLCIDEDSWELTEEDVKEKWDIKYFFKHIYNPHNDPQATKNISGDKCIEICPSCRDLNKTRSGTDERGQRYIMKELKMNKLRLLHIPQTGQQIRYCRYCDSIWPEYREVDNLYNHGGTLEMYLTLLGIIRFNDL